MQKVTALIICTLLITSVCAETYTLNAVEAALCTILDFCDLLSSLGVGSSGGTSPGPSDDISISSSLQLGINIGSSLNVNSITFGGASGSILNITKSAIVVIGSTLTASSGAVVNVVGSVTVAGASTVQSGAGVIVAAGGSVAFTGGVNVNAGATGSNQGLVVNSWGQLTISANSTINGAFTLAQSSSFIIYSGFVTSANAIVAAGNTTIQGTLALATAAFTYTQSQGNLILSSASNTQATLSANVNINANCYLRGNGNITGNLNIQSSGSAGGVIAPGNSPGTVYVSGNFALSSSSTYELEIASSSSYDRVIVSGTTYVDGILYATFLSGYQPASTQAYTFITSAGAVSGTFNVVHGDYNSNLDKFTQTENSHSVVATYNSGVSVVASTLFLIVACAVAIL